MKTVSKNRKSSKSNKVANKAKAAKAERSNGKPKVDQWGFEVGSVQAKVNKLLSTKPQTVREMADKGDINHRRVRYQCRVLTRLKLAKRTDEGYAWRSKGSK
jgi:hypothetical protein